MKKSFKIGGIHPKENKYTKESIIENFPLVKKAAISMSQHLGAPSEPIVNKGQSVKVGELLAKPNGFISSNIHSPFSGTISSIEMYPDLSGNMVQHVFIDVEEDIWIEGIDRSSQLIKENSLTSKEIVNKIAEMGVVGMGGAAFPTHIKLTPPPSKKADYLIVNGAECEPYLTSDYRLMIENPQEVLVGVELMMKALNVTKAFLGIEDNKPDAIKLMKQYTESSYNSIEVIILKSRYPQGGEKQLIKAVLGREVPSLGLPIDVGVVVQNVGTAFAVYEAVQKNKPLIDGIVTLTSDKLKIKKNLKVRAGTLYSDILEFYGINIGDLDKVVSGGPMMGKSVAKIESATVKSTSAVLLLSSRTTSREEESLCIRCSKCVNVCPMGLEPYLLNKLGKSTDKSNLLEVNRVQDCIECGSCQYTCPANIPLLDTIRYSKAQVIKNLRSRPKN